MRKRELEKIWRYLDKACESMEKLEQNEVDLGMVDFSAVVSLKNRVEELIEQKTRK